MRVEQLDQLGEVGKRARQPVDLVGKDPRSDPREFPLWTRAPQTASRLRGRIQTVLEAAQALGHIAEDKACPARWRGHLDKLLPKPAKLTRGHQKALPYADVPAFVARLRASGGMAALALEFLILTATRTSETLNAQWGEFDLDNAVWSIPPGRMKTNEAFSVPLSDRALEILAEARRAARKEPAADSFVFPGVIPKKPLSSGALAMLLQAYGRGRDRDRARVPHQLPDVVFGCRAHRVRGRRGLPVAPGRQRGEPGLCPQQHAGEASARDGGLGAILGGRGALDQGQEDRA